MNAAAPDCVFESFIRSASPVELRKLAAMIEADPGATTKCIAMAGLVRILADQVEDDLAAIVGAAA